MNGAPRSTILNTVKLTEEGVCLITARLLLNLLTNILIFFTVFISILFSCRTTNLTVFELHIILSVLGYQFFMCQGILVMSKYNSWSTLMKMRQRKHLHWILQVLALILVVTGSFIMIKEKHNNFNTAHGVLALCALILSVLSFMNGALMQNAHTFSYSEKVAIIRFTHCVTGISSLFCATAALCFGFETHSFKTWMDNDNAVKCLMSLTWFFTLTVSLDFWIATNSRLRKFFS